MTADRDALREQLIAAQLANESFPGTDGYRSIRIRTNEDAANRALPVVDTYAAQVRRDALAPVLALCRDRQAESVDGGLTDVDTLWPSEVLRAAGVTEEET